MCFWGGFGAALPPWPLKCAFWGGFGAAWTLDSSSPWPQKMCFVGGFGTVIIMTFQVTLIAGSEPSLAARPGGLWEPLLPFLERVLWDPISCSPREGKASLRHRFVGSKLAKQPGFFLGACAHCFLGNRSAKNVLFGGGFGAALASENMLFWEVLPQNKW